MPESFESAETDGRRGVSLSRAGQGLRRALALRAAAGPTRKGDLHAREDVRHLWFVDSDPRTLDARLSSCVGYICCCWRRSSMTLEENWSLGDSVVQQRSIQDFGVFDEGFPVVWADLPRKKASI